MILDLGSSPLADSFPREPVSETRYSLDLLLCVNCGQVQLGEIVDDEVLFGKDYAFFTGSSPSLVEHYADYAHAMLKDFPQQCREGVLEVASNDGTLLKHFADVGCPVLGVDPALPPAEAAAKSGIPTRIRAFSEAEAQEIATVTLGGHLGKRPGLIIANNVLAHVADPLDMMRGIAALLASDGVAVVEVQYFPDLFFGNEWDHVYHEHRTYLTLHSVAALAELAELRVVDVSNSPTQGGSIRVFLKRQGVPTPKATAMFEREMALGLRSPRTYATWQARVDYGRERLREIVWDFRSEGKTVAGYGASAKSSTLLNYCGFGPSDLAYVEDTTPYKIGCLTPGTHIPIVGPKTQPFPDAYLLLIWNYLGGVVRRNRRFMEEGGKFIVPIPHPVVI
jgi:SAM-dependent methyltransferase